MCSKAFISRLASILALSSWYLFSVSDAATCTPPCLNGGSCSAANTCLCVSGWYGSLCENLASCAIPRPVNGYCTAPDTCTCLSGWAGPNCDIATQWMNNPTTYLPQYSLDPYAGNLALWDVYIRPTLIGNPNPRPDGGYRILGPAYNHHGTIWTKAPIDGLPNFTVNATIGVGNNGDNGDGVTVEIVPDSAIIRPASSNISPNHYFGRTTNSYTGLFINIYPYHGKICMGLINVPSNQSGMQNPYLCWSGSTILGFANNNYVRQKWTLGFQVVNYVAKSLFVCNATYCKTIFQNLSWDLLSLVGPLHLGVVGKAYGAWDTIDVYDVKVYPTGPCGTGCVFGQCINTSPMTCVCSSGYTGATCNIAISAICVTNVCQNGGTCIASETCLCPPGYSGPNCTLAVGSIFQSAVDYRLIGAVVIASFGPPIVRTSSQCAVKCQETAGCASANYRISDGSCFLLDKEFGGPNNVTLTCDADYVHWAINIRALPKTIQNRVMGCMSLNGACPKPYQVCKNTCTSNRWVSSCQNKVYLTCLDAYNQGERGNGIYMIKPDSGAAFEIYCNMESDDIAGGGGGYTTVLRRQDGSFDFTALTSTTVKNFNGDLNGEFFVGGDLLNRLTQPTKELLILAWPFESDKAKVFGRWASFSVGVGPVYNLSATGYSSSPQVSNDMLRAMVGRALKTSDNDVGGCIAQAKGPMWTGSNPCHLMNPLGRYLYGYQTSSNNGINIADYMGYSYSMQRFEWRLK